MGMNKPLFDIDRTDLQVAVNKFAENLGSGMAWSKLFPLKYTRRFDLKGVEGDEGIAISADRVAFNTKAPAKTRKNVGSWSGKLEKIAVAREKDEEAINDYKDLQILASASENPADARELVDLVYNDVKFVDKAMNIKVEIDALRIGSSGIKAYDATIDGENATQDIINFNVPSANYSGAATVWATSATADGIADIVAEQERIASTGYAKPMYAIMEKAAFTKLRNQKAVANRLFPQAKSLAMVTGDMVTLDAINSYMASNGFPTLVVIDSYAAVQDKAGNESIIKPWNVNVVTLAPTLQLGDTYYKVVPNVENSDALQVVGDGGFYKLSRYSDLNPMVEVTMGEAYVLPVLRNRRSTCFINIANTSWNNGAE